MKKEILELQKKITEDMKQEKKSLYEFIKKGIKNIDNLSSAGLLGLKCDVESMLGYNHIAPTNMSNTGNLSTIERNYEGNSIKTDYNG